ncbi:single-stranded DNA-binding protein [Candidatus Dependentiae bacterium]|nr:single-stranded DNA-binding protein [Candidatus Dependentiae bacterium]
MASFNRVIMIGNLTRDPEHKQLASGQAVCRLGLASNRQFKNKQTGTMVQEVCFVDVDVWGPQAESCRQFLAKGRPVLVEGRLKLDSWQEADGSKRSKHSIVADRVTFLSSNQQEDGLDDYDAASSAAPMASMQSQEAVAPKTRIKKAAQKDEEMGTSTGEIAFKDQKPFEDDLPF